MQELASQSARYGTTALYLSTLSIDTVNITFPSPQLACDLVARTPSTGRRSPEQTPFVHWLIPSAHFHLPPTEQCSGRGLHMLWAPERSGAIPHLLDARRKALLLVYEVLVLKGLTRSQSVCQACGLQHKLEYTLKLTQSSQIS